MLTPIVRHASRAFTASSLRPCGPEEPRLASAASFHFSAAPPAPRRWARRRQFITMRPRSF